MADETAQLFGVEVLFSSDPGAEIEDPSAANHLYHIAREALHNAVKHSGADRVEVSLDVEDGELVLRVRDLGKGFDPAAQRIGLGMGILRHRADLIGGDLRIESSPDAGTTVTCRIPGNLD